MQSFRLYVNNFEGRLTSTGEYLYAAEAAWQEYHSPGSTMTRVEYEEVIVQLGLAVLGCMSAAVFETHLPRYRPEEVRWDQPITVLAPSCNNAWT